MQVKSQNIYPDDMASSTAKNSSINMRASKVSVKQSMYNKYGSIGREYGR